MYLHTTQQSAELKSKCLIEETVISAFGGKCWQMDNQNPPKWPISTLYTSPAKYILIKIIDPIYLTSKYQNISVIE